MTAAVLADPTGQWLCKPCRLVDQRSTAARADLTSDAPCWKCQAVVKTGERMYYVVAHREPV
jgi:hypothetical protein